MAYNMNMQWMLDAGLAVALAIVLGGCAPAEATPPRQPTGVDGRRAAEPSMDQKRAGGRPALDGYRPVVTVDNLTPLGDARVPFASYLVAIHNRLHPIFAEKQIDFFSSLPKDDPLNDMTLSTSVEMVLDKDTGKIVQLGVTRSSGNAAYDGAALIAVERAAPFGKAPDVIASPDGNVYVHWEFHRDPFDACTTRNARPFLLARAPSPPLKVDKSRPVQLVRWSWNCPFPPEADVDGVDSAIVSLRVLVQPDGTPSDAWIISDPGHGFGRAARACVLARPYAPARDRSGTPILGYGIVNVRFQR